MIAVQQLEYRWPNFTLELPSWHVQPDETWAISGRSGSGKTTLLRLLSGELPASGQLCVLGERLDLDSESQRRAFRLRRLGMIFQDFPLMEALDVVDNVLLPRRLCGRRDGRDRALGLLEDLKVKGGAVSALSQGERQRVAVARALINDPALVLADEPTSGLDPRGAQRVMDLLLSLDRTLVVVTHDPAIRERLGQVLEL